MTDERWEDVQHREEWWMARQRQTKHTDLHVGRLVGKLEVKKDVDWGWTPASEEIKRSKRRKLSRTLSLASTARSRRETAKAPLKPPGGDKLS